MLLRLGGMKDIDAKDEGRPVDTKGASFSGEQIDDRCRQRGGRKPREKHDFILPIRQPLLVLLRILLILAELFHQLAFPVTMHHRNSLILTVFSVFGHMRVIIRDDKETAETLRKKSCEEKEYKQLAV